MEARNGKFNLEEDDFSESFFSGIHESDEDFSEQGTLYAQCLWDVKDEERHYTLNSVTDTKEFDTAFLMLYAPINTYKDRKLVRSYEDDVKARQMEYDHFWIIYPCLVNNEKRNPKEVVKVDKYDVDMKQTMQTFIKNYSPKAQKVIIIFNGHGASRGLALSEEPQDIPLNEVIKDVEDFQKESIAGRGVDLMDAAKDKSLHGSVELVFAQCYSHEFAGAPKVAGDIACRGFLHVIAMSDDKHKTTKSHTKSEVDPYTRKKVMFECRHATLEKKYNPTKVPGCHATK